MKIARLFLIYIILLLSTGCISLSYSRFQKFDDEFGKSRKLISRISLRPTEKRTEINSAYVVLAREISVGSDNTKAYFVVSRSTKSFTIEDIGFLKAGSTTFEIKIANIISENKSKSSATFQTYAGADSTGAGAGVMADMDERIWIDDKFIINLTPEMTSEIKKAGEFFLRFYFGPVPATFRFKGSKFRPIEKLLWEEMIN